MWSEQRGYSHFYILNVKLQLISKLQLQNSRKSFEKALHTFHNTWRAFGFE